MIGKMKPSLRAKTLCSVWQSNLSETDKRCIADVFTDYEKMKAEKKSQTPSLFGQDYRFCNLLGETLVFSKKLNHYNDVIKELKTEAIKEFWNTLKSSSTQGFWDSTSYVTVEDGDDLVKEMTEEQND